MIALKHKEKSALNDTQNLTSNLKEGSVDRLQTDEFAKISKYLINNAPATIDLCSSSKTKPVTIKNLENFLKLKKIDIDIGNLAKLSMEKYPKAYLLEDEEDEEDMLNCLGEEATPYQRVLAEARRLNINVERANYSNTWPEASTSSRHIKRKKGNHYSLTSGIDFVKSSKNSMKNKKHHPLPSNVDTESYNNIKVCGKYRPGTAPSNWNSLINTFNRTEEALNLNNHDRINIIPEKKKDLEFHLDSTPLTIDNKNEHETLKEEKKIIEIGKKNTLGYSKIPKPLPSKKENLISKIDQGSLSKYIPLSRFF